jgi:hypothetical protein
MNPYQPPQADNAPPRTESTRDPFFSAIKVGAIVQLVLLVLTALVLDGGQLNRLCVVAIIGYWVGVAVVMIRRRTSPTRVDLLFLRYGPLGLMILIPAIACAVRWIIGKSP